MPSHLVTVRRAVPADAGAIDALYRQLVTIPAVSVLPERIFAAASDPNTFLLVCEQAERLCATALLSLCTDVMFGLQPFAVVENVAVDSAVRRQGVGTQLFRHIESLCKENSCSKIMLLSSSARTEAHSFFESLGFAGSSKRAFVKYRAQFGARA